MFNRELNKTIGAKQILSESALKRARIYSTRRIFHITRVHIWKKEILKVYTKVMVCNLKVQTINTSTCIQYFIMQIFWFSTHRLKLSHLCKRLSATPDRPNEVSKQQRNLVNLKRLFLKALRKWIPTLYLSY